MILRRRLQFQLQAGQPPMTARLSLVIAILLAVKFLAISPLCLCHFSIYELGRAHFNEQEFHHPSTDTAESLAPSSLCAHHENGLDIHSIPTQEPFIRSHAISFLNNCEFKTLGIESTSLTVLIYDPPPDKPPKIASI